MAKKKTAKKETETPEEEIPEEEDEELENLMFGDSGDSDEDTPSSSANQGETPGDSGSFSDLEDEAEEEQEKDDYRHLKARYIEKFGDSHSVEFKGVSHGFLNYLVSILLKDKGVKYSAYKETSIHPPVLSLILDDKKTVTKTLLSACDVMEKEVQDLKNAIEKTF